MSDETDPELSKIEQVAAILGANFKDYLIAVRMKDGNMAWHQSNEIWALGAVTRYSTHLGDKAMLDQIDARSCDKGEQGD